MLYQLLVDHILKEQEKFYKIAYSYVKSREDALDIVQDTIEKALKSYHKIKQPEYLSTWFYRVLVNTAMNHIKSKKAVVMLDASLESGYLDQNHLDLYDALDLLNPEDKTLIILRYFEDLKFHDIAEIMSLNINTIKTRHKNILSHLKIQLDEGGDHASL